MERLSIQEAGLENLPRIRGHHLNNLILIYALASYNGVKLTNGGYTETIPKNVQEIVNAGVVKTAKAVTSPLLFWFDPNKVNKAKEYMLDVIGEGEGDFMNYLNKLYAVIIQIISASSKDKLLLTQTPDLLCGACKVGNHCRRKGLVTGSRDVDAVAISTYIGKIPSRNGLIKQHYYEKYSYTDQTSEEDIPVVLTDFRTLRRYIKAQAKNFLGQ